MIHNQFTNTSLLPSLHVPYNITGSAKHIHKQSHARTRAHTGANYAVSDTYI